MENVLILMMIQAVLTFVMSTVKNPAKAASVKAGLIQLRDALNSLYPPTASVKRRK